MKEFLSHLHEQEVPKENAHTVLTMSNNIDVLQSIKSFQPNLHEEDVKRTINAIVTFLQDNPSREGDETIDAFILTVDRKRALKQSKDDDLS